jgi:hypothetical protein
MWAPTYWSSRFASTPNGPGIQAAWDELYPFADDRALDVAQRLGLGDDAGTLAKAVSKKDYPRLVAALIRAGLAGDDEVDRLRTA